MQGDWDNDLRHAEIDKVDDQDGDTGNCWDEEFMAPPDIEEIVTDSKDYYRLEGEDGREVGCELFVSVSIFSFNFPSRLQFK